METKDIWVKLEDVIDLLLEWADARINPAFEKIEHIKPGHGNCCTCQTCGYLYDECVCAHNEIVSTIEKWEKRKRLKTRIK